jgi:cytoskeletal protein RodZ
MKEIGDLLQKARIKKKLSLEEINDETKIRLDQLKAIEAGDFQKLPGEVYVKGFIMNFARAVGLDEHEVLKKYYELKNATETGTDVEASADTGPSPAEGQQQTRGLPPEIPFSGRHFKMKKAKAKRSFGKRVSLPQVITGLLLVALLVTGGFFAYHRFTAGQTTVPETMPKSAEDEETPLPQGEAPAGSDPDGRETTRTGFEWQVDDEDRAEQRESAPPVLKARALSAVWIGLYQKDSGEMLFEGTLRPQDTREWILTEPVQLKVGNARGLHLIFNGQDLGILGAEGEVKKLEFSPGSGVKQI